MLGPRTVTLAACAGTAAIATARAAEIVLPAAANTNQTDVDPTRRLADNQYLFQLCGLDLVGRDQSSVQFFSPNGCPTICADSKKPCDAMTWTSYNGGTCWLKTFGGSLLPKTTKNPDAVSFFYQSFLSGVDLYDYEAADGYDMPGYDLGSSRGTEGDCFSACRANPKCFAYVWTDFEGGTCWLKSRVSPPVRKNGAKLRIYARRANVWNACPSL